MFFDPPQRRIWLYRDPVDMRKGHNNLSYLVTHVVLRDLMSRDIFLFVSKDRKSFKAIVWDGSGLCLFHKRLNRGRVMSFSHLPKANEYEVTRSGAVAREMLKGFRGVVMCDGYSGYHRLQDNDGLIYAQCWAHCRRKLFDAMTKHPEAKRAVELIDLLFEIDRKATDLQHLNKLRANESKAIIAEFDAYLDSRRGKFLESMAFGKAVTYYDERKEALHQFLSHSVVPLDNNTAERALRAPVMGRNNFQGFRSIDGADVAMTFYSIITSCKAVKVEPRTYMLAIAMDLRALRSL